jgi:nicotinamidase/pyrazinamidase
VIAVTAGRAQCFNEAIENSPESTPRHDLTAVIEGFSPSCALLVVDVQNDFAHPKGGLHVSGGDAVIPLINDLVAAAEDAGALVAYTQDWHPEETPHFQTHGGPWPVHGVRDTWGAQLHSDLHVAGPVIRKATGHEDGYSGFTARHIVSGADVPTGLEALLREHAIERVVIVGLAQDYCVVETALDARRLGFDTTVVLDATRPVAEHTGAAAIDRMRAAGVHLC